MSGITQTYLFDTSANFTTSNTTVDEVIDRGRLAYMDNPLQVFSQDFASSAGFTFDAAKVEFSGGLVTQLDQTPANSIFGCNFNTTNLDWHKSGGSLTGVVVGTPTLASNELDCVGTEGVYFSRNSETQETHKFTYTPNYSGSPAGDRNIIAGYNGSDNANRWSLVHKSSDGTFRLYMFNSASGAIFNNIQVGSAWSPTASQDYEIEISIDSIGGKIRLFLDGTLRTELSTAAWTRSVAATRFEIGQSASITNSADAKFSKYIFFTGIQHTASYTAGYTIPDFIYAESKVDLPNFIYSDSGEIQSLDNITSTESGTPRYIIDGKYWNGAAWVASSGAYAQANSKADALTNIAALTPPTSTLPVSIVFPGLNTISNVDQLDITYTGQVYESLGYIEPIAGISVSSLISYSQTIVTPINTDFGVVLKIDGILKYWDGLAWVTSDGSLAQSNTAAECNDNLDSLSFGSNSTVIPRWVLYSSDNTVTPTIETSSINYNFGGIAVDTTECIVYGYLKDIRGVAVAGAKLTFNLVFTGSKIYKEASSNIIFPSAVSVFTDAAGYFSIPLIRSSEFEEATTYKVSILNRGETVDTGTSGILDFSVPDAMSKDITELLPIP